MIHIFFSNNKWFLHEGDLPVKPDEIKYSLLDLEAWKRDINTYNQSIADIKAKALEIANPELVGQIAELVGQIVVMPDPVSESVNGTVFYQWPGTFERKETLYANDKYEVKYKTEVAHLVLPPEEKNMNEPIPPEYYLNGPDEFMNPNESTSAPVEKEDPYVKSQLLIEIEANNTLRKENHNLKKCCHDNATESTERFQRCIELQEENARLRRLIERLFFGDALWMYEPHSKQQVQKGWEQFKKDNNL